MALFRHTRPEPETVFTPREPLNEDMYVERRTLETRFDRAIRGSQHIAIFGDSGNGKTWLYQKVLKIKNIPYRLVDLSIARTSGIDNAFRAALEKPYGWQPDQQTDSKESGLNFALKAGESRDTQYTFADKPPFEKLIDELAAQTKNQKFIIFDNLESVADDKEVLRALSGYILRLDNPRFFNSGVRFLFVGVISDMRRILSGSDHSVTIQNRIIELPEVKRLTAFEAEKIFRTGFFDKLDIEFDFDEDVGSGPIDLLEALRRA